MATTIHRNITSSMQPKKYSKMTSKHRYLQSHAKLLSVIILYFLVSTWLLMMFNETRDKMAIIDIIHNIPIPSSQHHDVMPSQSALLVEMEEIFNDTTMKNWRSQARTRCDQSYISYASLFAMLHSVIVDPQKAIGPKGGEDIYSVINQTESSEYYTFKPGAFNITCSAETTLTNKSLFNANFHLYQWDKALVINPLSSKDSVAQDDTFTIAITRYEYANLFHTMRDFYNAFLVMSFFGRRPSQTNILIIDGHPYGGLDDIWKTLFTNVYRIGHMERPMKFLDLAWGITGFESPISHRDILEIPFVEEFRKFFLKQHNVSQTRQLNCDNLSILFLWRRDYVAHPRNPSGHVVRKIQNEDELITSIRKLHPNYNITGIQLDLLDFRDQLRVITSTDILIAMHGAGLAHILFLPSYSSVIELYPMYRPISNVIFKDMARWRHLHYEAWQNSEIKNERWNGLTYIPPSRLKNMVQRQVDKMCKSSRNDT